MSSHISREPVDKVLTLGGQLGTTHLSDSLHYVLDARDGCLQLGQRHVGSGQQGPGEASLRSLEARDFWRDVGTRPRKASGDIV